MRGEWVRKPTGFTSAVFVHRIFSSGVALSKVDLHLCQLFKYTSYRRMFL